MVATTTAGTLADPFGRTSPGGAPASDTRVAVVAALSEALGAHDPDTVSHCRRVARHALALARELGLDHVAPERLRAAALLHDIGKIGVPDWVLRKQGPLDDHEWALVRAHARIGHDILDAAGLDNEAHWLLHHHERYDGCGYPAGLSGEEIPLQSRIIFVADAFDAMTQNRPYARARSITDAILEIERGARTQFDPVCAAAAARALGPRVR